MTDGEIIKAFEQCGTGKCPTDCVYRKDESRCDAKRLHKDILDLIRRKQSENARTQSLEEKTLKKAAEWIERCGLDCCSVCANLPFSEWEGAGDVPDDVEPCPFRRKDGDNACINGIIEYFKREAAASQ